ncbi:MAG: 6-bladed beta-propeller [Gemmatimonadota bacterium]|nr:6-bladed beta-propeller [Gemmatimonadota bacterium]
MRESNTGTAARSGQWRLFRLGVWALVFLWAAPVEGQALTEIGVAPTDGTILGEVTDVDILPNGNFVVMDIQAATVYVFDPSGRQVHALGGSGEGPGEIQLSAEVEVGPDGDIMIVDARNHRMTRWARDGTLIGSTRFSQLIGSFPFWPHDLMWEGDVLVLKISGFMPDQPIEFYALPLTLDGTAKILVSLEKEEGPTCLFCAVTLGTSGELVVFRGDTLYQLHRLDSLGAVSATWSRSDLPAVRRSEEEIKQRRSDMSRRMGVESGTPGISDIPPFKTRFGPRSIDVDDAGRLWTAPRQAEGDGGSLDVFTPSGEYSHSIALGVPIKHIRIRGNYLVVATETPVGEPVVRLYRIDS